MPDLKNIEKAEMPVAGVAGPNEYSPLVTALAKTFDKAKGHSDVVRLWLNPDDPENDKNAARVGLTHATSLLTPRLSARIKQEDKDGKPSIIVWLAPFIARVRKDAEQE